MNKKLSHMNLKQIEQIIEDVTTDYIDEYIKKPALRSHIEEFHKTCKWYKKLYYTIFQSSRYKKIATILSKLDSFSDESNERFVQRMMKEHADFFSNIEGLSLDEQQQRAVITDDNYNLVLAGAGSGKTLTVAAKVKYLVEVKHVDPQDILLMSFTKKAAEEMTERISYKMKIPVSASTFHSLGYQIIYSVERKRPDVAMETEILVDRFFKDLAVSDKDLVKKILVFIGLYLDYQEFGDKTYAEMIKHSKMYSLYTFRSQYNPYIINNQIEDLQEQINNTQDEGVISQITDEIRQLEREKQTIIGERVKSIEEAKIANFFFLNGIRYQYERAYPYDLRENYRKNYRPDFYLPDYDFYWEHFGIDEEGRAPWLSEVEERKYIDGIEWKRNLHKKNNTRLIESYSYLNKNEKFEENLKKIIESNGIITRPIDYMKIYRALFVEGQNKGMNSFRKLMVTFLSLFKSNGMDHNWFDKINQEDLQTRDRLFFEIAEKVYDYYESELFHQKKIDFNDMINKASDYIREGGWLAHYKYIIVDEYQDISVSRYRLLKALVETTSAKLLCVGDDWQSIYRFTGSDLALFSEFQKYWGKFKLMKIEKTYRNSQDLIDIAGKFIERNPAQLKKSLKSDKSQNDPLFCIPYRSVKEVNHSNRLRSSGDALQYALEKINEIEKGKETEIMLLGRNNFDIDMIMKTRYYDLQKEQSVVRNDPRFQLESQDQSDDQKIRSVTFPNLHLEYLTVHKAKGLQADYVIIINLKDDITGFPNQISDDPILRYVLSDPEKYDYAEERRLFYVAITRTKKRVFLLSPVLNESVFSEEIMHDNSIEYLCPSGEDIKKLNFPKCPRCKGGKLVVRHSKQNEFLGCSNYPLCSYTIPDITVLDNPIKCSCGGYMIRKKGKYGLFMSCSNFPYCSLTLQKIWGEKRAGEYVKQISADYEAKENPEKKTIVTGHFSEKSTVDTNLSNSRTSGQFPSNRGARWTDEEDKMLLVEFKSGLSIREIAKNHQRSNGAIHSRLKKIQEEGKNLRE